MFPVNKIKQSGDKRLHATYTRPYLLCCKPEIMNSDQGSHFTNSTYLELLKKEGIKISMDGKGRGTDNSRTERFSARSSTNAST